MKKYYLLKVQYLGFRYFGWQRQKNFATIQGTLEDAAKKFLHEDERFFVMGSSRTDAKVHAFGQIVKFQCETEYEREELQKLFNDNLPIDIKVVDVKNTVGHLKVIYEAEEKEYLYFFRNDPNGDNIFMNPYICNFVEDIDLEKMKEAARLIEGEHDFKFFQYKGNPKNTTVRKIFHCEITEAKREYYGLQVPKGTYVLTIRGSGFLRHMVRILMGGLINIGKGNKTIDDLQAALRGEGDDDTRVGFIVQSYGLFLHWIRLRHYPHLEKQKSLELTSSLENQEIE